MAMLFILASCTAQQINAEIQKEVQMAAKLTITSIFENNTKIPIKYTCDGANINPPLSISGIPKETKSLVLILDDPDAPIGTFTHWVVFNIPVASSIKENSVPGIEGMNSARISSYTGPCPPLGVHRYFFKFYALDTKLNLAARASKADVENAMKNHILAQGELIGLYSRQR